MMLNELKVNEKRIIQKITPNCLSSQRLIELGFTSGQEIQILNRAPFNGAISVSIRGAIFALRLNDAKLIIIE